MQTKPEVEVGAISGARQVPLLHREQLVAGVIFTGIAADYVHEVISVEGDVVTLQRLPRRQQPKDHVHAYMLYNNTTCMCGRGQHVITLLLPEDHTTPRIHVLMPVGPVVAPDAYSIYLFAGGRTFIVHGDEGNEAPSLTSGIPVPVVLKARKVWGIPAEMLRVLDPK